MRHTRKLRRRPYFFIFSVENRKHRLRHKPKQDSSVFYRKSNILTPNVDTMLLISTGTIQIAHKFFWFRTEKPMACALATLLFIIFGGCCCYFGCHQTAKSAKYTVRSIVKIGFSYSAKNAFSFDWHEIETIYDGAISHVTHPICS